jgi:hypothetical protein
MGNRGEMSGQGGGLAAWFDGSGRCRWAGHELGQPSLSIIYITTVSRQSTELLFYPFSGHLSFLSVDHHLLFLSFPSFFSDFLAVPVLHFLQPELDVLTRCFKDIHYKKHY